MPRPWGVVLAGGDGTRLHGVTTALTGEPTPKQFCRLLGHKTLLDETIHRLTGIVDARRTAVLVSAAHQRYYESLRATRPPGLIIEQPVNNGTALGMTFALGRIRRTDRDAVVGFFPSDHHYADLSVFREATSAAYRIAAQHPDRLVLVGATPHSPEQDYGWIEAGPALAWPEADHAVFAVNRFWEKPEAVVANRLFRQRALWNTFITVGTVDAFRGALQATQPELAASLDQIAAAAAGADEERIVLDAYGRFPRLCFSAHVLAAAPSRCVAVPLRASGWVDIGRPDRLADVHRPALSA
jgi:mannose-1-phosphate guanylyltransferase